MYDLEEFRAQIEALYRNCTMGSSPPPNHVYCLVCERFASELPLCPHLTAMVASQRPWCTD